MMPLILETSGVAPKRLVAGAGRSCSFDDKEQRIHAAMPTGGSGSRILGLELNLLLAEVAWTNGFASGAHGWLRYLRT
jgi:hypothetical protein